MSRFYELIKNDKTIINIYNKIHKYEDEETGGYIWYDSDESSDNIWEISEKMDINSYYIIISFECQCFR